MLCRLTDNRPTARIIKKKHNDVSRMICVVMCFTYLQEIPPFETKGVMRASFSSRDADNHTAFIRIKTNASDEDEFIILPMEVEVTAGPFSLQNEEVSKNSE